MHRFSIVLVAIAATLLSSPSLGQGGPPPALVRLDAVRMEPVNLQREVTGELVSLLRSDLAAEEDGLVTSLSVREGDRVEAGQIIAQLDTDLAVLEVERAQAEINSRQGVVDQRAAELAQARRDLERFRELDQQGSASTGELDRAETAVLRLIAQSAQAAADLAVARVLAREAQTRLDKRTIRAPFAGRVLARSTEVGQWVQSGDSIVELVSLEQIEARLDVPEAFIGQLRRPGVMVTLRIAALTAPAASPESVADPANSANPADAAWAGPSAAEPTRRQPMELRAPITAIIPSVDPRSRLFPIRVKIDNPGELAQPGMSVVGLIPTGTREPQLTIHKDAILRDDAGEYVYMNGGGQAIPMRIRSRFAVGDRVVIARGSLQPGMQLIVEGNERLFPTQPLNIINDQPPGDTTDARPDQGA